MWNKTEMYARKGKQVLPFGVWSPWLSKKNTRIVSFCVAQAANTIGIDRNKLPCLLWFATSTGIFDSKLVSILLVFLLRCVRVWQYGSLGSWHQAPSKELFCTLYLVAANQAAPHCSKQPSSGISLEALAGKHINKCTARKVAAKVTQYAIATTGADRQTDEKRHIVGFFFVCLIRDPHDRCFVAGV